MNRFDDPQYRAMLRQVQKPARYTGGELHAVDKRPSFFNLDPQVRVHFALCFPDLYEIGMSNLAMQILYDILNRRDNTFCERCFAPAPDLRSFLKTRGLPLTSLETRTPLSDFDMLGFSLGYELAYTSVLEMLSLGGIPLESVDRKESDPLIIAGGPIACNLEPMAPFFDVIFLGDGEEALSEIIQAVHLKKRSGLSRLEFLRLVSQIPGVYVPSFYRARYHEDGTLRKIEAVDACAPQQVEKRLVRDLNQARMPLNPILPNLEVVHDRMVMEVFRGCARGCRFCQAGFTYRPMRERSKDTLFAAATALISNTGCDEIGLLSLSTTDYSKLEELVRELLPITEPRHINLSLPSIRLDAFDFELAKQIAQTRRAGLTFAPEAGTQRLRDVINKNITEDDMVNAAKTAFLNGWSRLKLYFMLGLPTETREDVDGIVALTRQFLAAWDDLPRDKRSKRVHVTVSTSFFIPKPFTPFQWSRQISLDEMREKQQQLADKLSDRRVAFHWHEFESSLLEAVLSRGDRRLAPVIRKAWEAGCYLDAWHEHFRWDLWQEALAMIEEGTDFYTRERPEDEVFPWDHLDIGVTRSFLWDEWQESKRGETTAACLERCSVCGCQHYETGICRSHSKLKGTV
ncbi:MAG TPA: TIGR03960 family B12-binding radical SAM protein [Clostridia bacterium]|nr:TIGR03960 family B12-binding radical SAM protein [Clostridia bacterium]